MRKGNLSTNFSIFLLLSPLLSTDCIQKIQYRQIFNQPNLSIIIQRRMQRVVIKKEWLAYMRLDVRPTNQFYDRTQLAKREILQLKRDLGLERETDTSLHHIFPGNQIQSLMIRYRQDNPSSLINLLDNHSNRYAAIQKTMLVYINKGNEAAAMESCWSSIFWYRNNLVYGPKEDRRSDDPGDSIDQPILLSQDFKYQDAMKAINSAYIAGQLFQSLDGFLKLTPTKNVTWVQNPTTSKWSVGKKLSNYPGNVGFDY